MLANVFNQEDLFFKKQVDFTASTSLSLIYTFTAPITGYYNLTFEPVYVNSIPQECCVCDSNNTASYARLCSNNVTYCNTATCSIAGLRLTAGTKLYVFARYAYSNNANGLKVFGKVSPIRMS